MSESNTKSKLYNEVASKKKFLRVYKKGEKKFSINIPKKAFDRICQFYGYERLTPNSFIIYHTEEVIKTFSRLKTQKKEIDDNEGEKVLEAVDDYYIVPKNLYEYDEEQQYDLSVKVKSKHIKDIIKKAELDLGEIIELINIQIVTQEEQETTQIQVNYFVYETIFKFVPLLKVIFDNNENFEIAFYSYRTILSKCGIKLEKIIPYLKIKKENINREELMKKVIPLYESAKIRKSKEIINEDIKDHKLYILKGCNTLKRYPKSPFDDFELNRNEETILLYDLINQIEEKQKKAKSIYDNIDNHIIEINDKDNKVKYIRKKIFDSVISSPESKFDEYKINDINENEIIVSKNVLKGNKSSPLVKLYNKNNPKDEYIYVPKKDVETNFNKLKYTRQQENFKGKDKNDEQKDIKYLLMDVECDTLPKLDDSKPLYSIPGESAIYDDTKNNLTNKLNDKNILICQTKNKFIPFDTINNIKERDSGVKNKNIKYKIKNIVNKEEIIIIEYKDIFDNDIPSDFVMIDNKDNPDDKFIVNKNDLLKEINSWENPNNDIKIKNQINNNEIIINPSNINIITPEKQELPENYENIQNEIKDKIKPENKIIKSNNYYIKKTIAKKIIDDPEEYDIYYIIDINNKKVKISKKQLKKDNDDDACEYISVSSKDEPNKKIIVNTKQIINKLDEDPIEEIISIDDDEGKNHKIKKTTIIINPIEIEDIDLEEQPEKIKKDLLKDITDYFYLYNDEEKKPHYIRVDTLKLIKNYKSDHPIENFEVDDEKGNKIKIPKEEAVKLLEAKIEPKYISLDDEETAGEPVLANLDIIEKSENDIDEPIQINKEGKKIKLKKIKLTKLKEIKSLPEQPEEKEYETIDILIKDIQKKEPLSDIVQVKDSKDNNIFIYEDTLNKIEENKADPDKTTYKGNTPMKEEIICRKKPNKVSPNTYIKLVEPNIIVDKNELEKELKQYKPSKKTINVKDIKGNKSEFDPLNVHIYKASPEETDVTKILPDDFSDINEKLLIDIVPQNKLILTKDINNKNIIIKKKEGDNLVKYPKTDFDEYIILDKDGQKVKVSRKKIEDDNLDNKCEYIEIKDDSNNENQIVYVNDFIEALKDKENEEFEIENKERKKIKLNKKKITIIKQNNQYIDIPEQGGDIKKKLLSEIKDSFIKVKDSKNNRDTYLRKSQLNEIVNHKQKAPFINYEIINHRKEQVYVTKEICQEKLSDSPNDKFILCYDETQKEKSFLVPLVNIQNTKCEGDEEFDCGNGNKVIFKNLRIKKLADAPEMGPQPEEEKMVKVVNLINKVKAGPLNKNYKTKNIEGQPCFVSNDYINKLQNESKGDNNNTQYKINDALGKNKLIINKETIDKDKKPGEYVLIKNKADNQKYIVDLKELINSLSSFKSTDDEIKIINALDNKTINLNPLNLEIVPPFNDFPLEKIDNKKISPNEDKNRRGVSLRSIPVRPQLPEKKSYKIRRAIIYKKQKNEP